MSDVLNYFQTILSWKHFAEIEKSKKNKMLEMFGDLNSNLYAIYRRNGLLFVNFVFEEAGKFTNSNFWKFLLLNSGFRHFTGLKVKPKFNLDVGACMEFCAQMIKVNFQHRIALILMAYFSPVWNEGAFQKYAFRSARLSACASGINFQPQTVEAAIHPSRLSALYRVQQRVLRAKREEISLFRPAS